MNWFMKENVRSVELKEKSMTTLYLSFLYGDQMCL